MTAVWRSAARAISLIGLAALIATPFNLFLDSQINFHNPIIAAVIKAPTTLVAMLLVSKLPLFRKRCEDSLKNSQINKSE